MIAADEMEYISPALAAADVWQRENKALSARVREWVGVGGGGVAHPAAHARRGGSIAHRHNPLTGLPNVCVP